MAASPTGPATWRMSFTHSSALPVPPPLRSSSLYVHLRHTSIEATPNMRVHHSHLLARCTLRVAGLSLLGFSEVPLVSIDPVFALPTPTLQRLGLREKEY